ncbi:MULTISPECIES: flagellar hook-associated protein FlgK [Clostridium]|uniref:flagellar hook-associated protein FlgK n=1 Tax=Clostridium TaxID=1485 RepID=UPI00069F7AB0|nr:MULTISPECIES: flagellar hook-associated protein FlgK [Clostridium]KOF55891.1 hypothetical protein AGR56_02355 [Clostridium sp. DMHC 10]MCD2345268.1 flagellar hook-associated protein FlgK [Clostridium guangxiense]
MAGLFSTLDISRLGLIAQQAALDVTSHNISNANTDGYTRQRAEMQALFDTEVHAGQPAGRGVEVSDITRIKDGFLDYQVRNQTSAEGTNKAINNYLGELQNVMNEPTDTGMASLLSNFFTNWHNLAVNPQTETTRGLVVSQTEALTDQLNSTYKKLQDLKANCNSEIDSEVSNINSTLDKIDDLNKQIINVKASGVEPNDLMDERDSLLNSLSEYFNINVDDKKLYGVDVTASNGSQLSGTSLVQVKDSDKEVRFSYVNNIQEVKNADGTVKTDSSGNPVYDLTYYRNGDKTSEKNRVDVYVSGLTQDQLNQIQTNRVLWADKDGNAIGLSVDSNGNTIASGQDSNHPINLTSDSSALNLFKSTNGTLKGTSSVQNDIDNYTDYLNKVAKAVALTVNTVESGSTSASSASDTLPFFVNSDVAKYTVDSNGKSELSGANLDAALAAEKDITAGNISINKEIADDPMKIKTRLSDVGNQDESDNTTDGNTDGKRAQAVADLANKLINIQGILPDTTRDNLFSASGLNQPLGVDSNGVNTVQNYAGGNTVSDYFTNIVTNLGTKVNEASTTLKNSKLQLQSLQQSRDSVSGVSLDEEMTNLIQFNHAYQANAKVIATVDELLDVVVNNLKK